VDAVLSHAVRPLYSTARRVDFSPTALLAEFASMRLSDIEREGAFNARVQNIRIGDAMGYTQDGTTWRDGSGKEVTGVLRALAGSKVGELNGAVKSLSVADALGYTLNDDGEYEDENGNPPSGILRVLMDSSLDSLASDAGNVYLGEIMGYDVLRNANGDLVNEAGTVVTTPVFRKGTPGNYSYPTGAVAEFVAMTVLELDDTAMTDKISNMKIGTAMGYTCVDGVWYSEHVSTGDSANVKVENNLLLAIIGTEVSNVDSVMQTMTLADVLGYDERPDGVDAEGNPKTKWYVSSDDDAAEVSGFMKLIGPDTPINEIDGAVSEMQTKMTVGDFVEADILEIDPLYATGLDYKVPGWRDLKLNDFVNALIRAAIGY
jgi:hypothetical protein